MRIAGLAKCSMVDFPGKIAAVVFTDGCNLNCWYCHNWRLIRGVPEEELIPEEEVFAFLASRVKKLDGVVVSGGEPTLQADLADFLRRVRAMGFAVKLDTNGTNPDALRALLEEGLVDYVAMDVKAPLARMEEVCGTAAYNGRIAMSMMVLRGGKAPFEFRTTLSPDLSEADREEVRRLCDGAVYKTNPYRPAPREE